MATTLTTPAVASHPLDSQFVLARRALRPNSCLEQTPRFKDDIWKLGPAIISESSRLLILNFNHIPQRFRPTVKELFYTMLAGNLPPGETRPEIATIRAHFTAITRFLGWLDTRPAVATGRRAERLDELIGADLQAYLRDLHTTQHSPMTRERSRVSIRMLWRYRTAIPDHLRFDPAHLEDWADDYRKRRTENATDRIPEQVHGPLMAWALRFIDDFGDDILAAIEHWQKARTALKGAILDDNTALVAGLRHLLDGHIADNRPLPGRRGTINQFALAHSLGCSKSEIDRHRALIAATAAIVGVDDQPWFNFAVTARIDGQPWAHRLVNEERSPYGVGRLATLLQAAAYATIAFLSGMRDCEKTSMRRDDLHAAAGSQLPAHATGWAIGYRSKSPLSDEAHRDTHSNYGMRASRRRTSSACRCVPVLSNMCCR